MRIFITTLVKFSALLLAAIMLLVWASNKFVKSSFHATSLSHETHYLFVGHSHVECVYNDTIIQNSLNIGKSGESYYYSYLKLKFLLSCTNNIETIFIGFSNNQISSELDKWIWEDRYLNEFYSNYAPLLECMDYKILAQNNLSGLLNTTSQSTRKNLTRIINSDYNFDQEFGQFSPATSSKINGSMYWRLYNNEVKQLDAAKSTVNLIYLRKLIDLCHSFKKEVVLLRSPLHPQYPKSINEELFKSYREEHLSDVDYFDLSSFPLTNNDYKDLSHLNHSGSKKLSTWFESIFLNHFKEEDFDQDFIETTLAHKTK